VEKAHKSYYFLGLGSVVKLWIVAADGYFVLEKNYSLDGWPGTANGHGSRALRSTDPKTLLNT